MNIVHITWLSGHNYGDDLMAKTIWEELRRRYVDLKVNIWCDEKPFSREGTRWIYKGIPRIGFLRRIINRRALLGADVLLVGGGTVLHSANSIGWKLEAVRLFKALHPTKPALGIGLSVGPFANKEEEAACAALLKIFDACALRDLASYEFAKNLDLPYEPIYAADLAGVFLKREGIGPKIQPKAIEKIGFVFNVPKADYHSALISTYGELLRKASERYKKLFLFAAATPPGGEDMKFIEEVLERSGIRERVEVRAYDNDPVSFTHLLRECDYVITSRLHGMVPSYFLSIPVTMISYRRKFEDFADSVGIPKNRRFTEANVSADAVLKDMTYYEQQGINESFTRSFRNFEVFDKI